MTVLQHPASKVLNAPTFTTSEELIKFMCTPDPKYAPLCQFPYINAGWNTVIDGGADPKGVYPDLVLNDCSITWADAVGSRYSILQAIYAAISAIIFLVSLRWLYLLRALRVSKGGKDKDKMNVGEKLSLLNCSASIIIFLISAIDQMSWRDTLPYIVNSAMTGFAASVMCSIAITLVTSWITIVDGGKSKVTPPWALYLSRFCISFITFDETCGALIETAVVMSRYAGSFSGRINAAKSLLAACVYFVYGFTCIFYGNKIGKALGAAGAEKGGPTAVIRRYCLIALVCLMLGVMYKLVFGIGRASSDYIYEMPPCSGFIYVNIVYILLFVVMTGILVGQNPASAAKKMAKVSTTTAKSSHDSVDEAKKP